MQLHYLEYGVSKQELEKFHTPILQRIIVVIQRFNKKPDTKEHQPITQPVLCAMLGRSDKNTRKGANLYSAFCLVFSDFLQIEKFTWALRNYNPDFRN